MSAMLKRRIKQAEEAIMPKPAQIVVILLDPGAEASADDRASFNQRIDSAIGNGQRVVIVDGSTNRDERAGVEYVDSEFEAQLIALATQPSEEGGKSRLSDMLAGLSGNVLGVRTFKESRK